MAKLRRRRNVQFDPAFESAWLKWGQAILHSQTLEREVGLWRETNTGPAGKFSTHYEAKRHGFAVVIEDIEPVPVRWQLLVGDIANNYRAALDHLAWALVSRGKAPPGVALTKSQENAVYFPICEDRDEFNSQIREPPNPKSRLKLPGARRADVAIVRAAQPYNRGARTRVLHPLMLLAGINNGDKHRTIQPLWSYPTRFDMKITDQRDCFVKGTEVWKRRGNPLEVGAEIALIPARRDGPNPEIDMQLEISSTPIIGNRITVRDWHVTTGILIFQMLREFSLQPKGIHELGVDLAPL